MKNLCTTSLFALSTALVWASPSLAQTADQSAQKSIGLEEIVVTATRRSENLQEVPVAVSAISSAQLTKQGVFETSD